MTALRLGIRKLFSHIPQMICLSLLLMVGVGFFITLSTISLRYEETAEEYFNDNAYADVTFYGVFNDDSVERLAARPGAGLVRGRTVQDFREGERVLRAVSLTKGVNEPYLYEGKLPESSEECVLLQRSAEAMGFGIGDTITLGEKELTITGLVASPEYVYMVQNERTTMAQPDTFAVLYVEQSFFAAGYNEIVALTDGSFDTDEAAQVVGAFQTTLQKNQINYIQYVADLEQVGSFANIFPVIFAVLIAAVIYVMLSRNIQKDRRQIGTMKALGVPDTTIIRIYLLQFGFVALIGALLGGLLAILVCGGIIDIFSAMFEVPALSFAFYPLLWLGAIATAVVLCAASALIALVRILPMLPAQAMRPAMPRGGGHRIRRREATIGRKLSWGTRYALKSALRSKGRFLAVVLGMCGSCALLVFSLGFNNSVTSTYNQYFNGFANYDAIISVDPMPIDYPNPVVQQVDSAYEALMMPTDVRGETLTLAVVPKGFDMVNIPADKLQTGVIVPEYFAQKWDVSAGDELEIEGNTVEISAVTPQALGLAIYTSFEYLDTVESGLPHVYNTIYAQSSHIEALTQYLKDNQIGFSTIEDDQTSFDSIMESLSVLIWFLIACSVLLGFTVLYSVGLINLSAREYEYMFMGVMGYPHRSIMAGHIKETLLQLVVAIPFGFWVGNLLLNSIKGEFSEGSFVISAEVFSQSYIYAALAVVGVTAVIAAVTSRHISRLDIVGGLKAQDE